MKKCYFNVKNMVIVLIITIIAFQSVVNALKIYQINGFINRLFLTNLVCFLFSVYYIFELVHTLYTSISFYDDYIIVSELLCRKVKLRYDGIGSIIIKKINNKNMIFFSRRVLFTNTFSKGQYANINEIYSIQYDDKIYDHLYIRLPLKQKEMLMNEYKKMN